MITEDEWIVYNVAMLTLLIEFEAFILISSFACLNLKDLMCFLNVQIISQN